MSLSPQNRPQKHPVEPLVRLLYGLDLHNIVNQHLNHFCIAKRYGADINDATCDWNWVGAIFRYFGRNIYIQLKVWEHSNGHNTPPMTSSSSPTSSPAAATPKTNPSSAPSATSFSSENPATGWLPSGRPTLWSSTSQPSSLRASLTKRLLSSSSPKKSPFPTPSTSA